MSRLAIVALLVVSCRSSEPGKGSAPGSGSGSVSREDCEAILEKADTLIGHDATTHPREPAKRAREIDECVAGATPEMLACAKAATSYEQLRACEKR